jgi:hypothetical protein
VSDDTEVSLKRIGLLLGIIATITSFVGAWAILPHRMNAAERRIEALESEARTSRELLVRIDENVKALKEARR